MQVIDDIIYLFAYQFLVRYERRAKIQVQDQAGLPSLGTFRPYKL